MGGPRYVISFEIAPKILTFKLIDSYKLIVKDAVILIRKNVRIKLSQMSLQNCNLKDNVSVGKLIIVKISK